jgi:uncharacterized protein YgiM (DUF1202 family)
MTPRIIFRYLVLWSILNASILYSRGVSADQENFPFLAEVTADHVNVRAGQNANFERLCQLNKGDEIVVLEKGFSWYKIQLPPSAKSYVHKEYIQFLGQNAGGVTGDRINIRAGAGVHHTILGQLTKGEQIFIEEDLEEWYRIQPVVGSYGWVSDQFLSFKSNDVSEYEAAVAAKTFVDIEKLEPVEADKPVEDDRKEVVEKEVVQSEIKSFYAVGYVEEYKDENNDDIHYKIVASGRPVCYVQGQNHILGRFKNLRVAVEGTVNQKFQSKYTHPVIIVSKVRLML